ncbi:hypothetical protein NIES4102_16920 [Chondrocystis sp. NIES-4102]|nr:hypothetical protein NIES4102_16920 [Chondrocystis sp. NIES-4102]
MNTPGHYIINLALLGKTITTFHNTAIALGAILPDLPIFSFYLINKYIYHLPETEIWSKAYYESFWQNIIASFHSIPLALLGTLICYYFNWQTGVLLFVSMICHSLFDLPVHNNDAHRHFYPFSDYRFISPFSYWDKNHYGQIVAFLEMLLILVSSPLAISLLNLPWTKGIVILIDLYYLLLYYRFYL